MKQRYRSVVDVHVLLIRDRRVLLIGRQGTGHADGWCTPPSGHLEEGEPVTTAAARETAEEVGVTIDPCQLRCATVVHHRSPGGEARVGFFFEALDWRGEPVNAEPHKCAGIAWYPVDLLPPNTVPYCAAGIRHYLADRPFALHGWAETPAA